MKTTTESSHIETIILKIIPRFAKAGISSKYGEPRFMQSRVRTTTTVCQKPVGEGAIAYSICLEVLLDADAKLVFPAVTGQLASAWIPFGGISRCCQLEEILKIIQTVAGFLSERISIFEAMKAYTSMGAFLPLKTDRKGLFEGRLSGRFGRFIPMICFLRSDPTGNSSGSGGNNAGRWERLVLFKKLKS